MKTNTLHRRGWDRIRTIQSIVMEIESEWASALGSERFRALRQELADLGRIVAERS